ncbi:D-lyxose/D-mannose family sugar isomerase [Candidatus Woesearchaeota archaeon]|nr:D-lyxose/D-mannose family sugar isomerase [Candidatus Woesearchaeota archaeon]
MPEKEFTMKRSEVNLIIRLMEHFIDQFGLNVSPTITDTTPARWAEITGSGNLRKTHGRIAKIGIGYDVTSLGTGNYFGIKEGEYLGLALITDINGDVNDTKDPITYAKRFMFSGYEQAAPSHYHPFKTETIGVVAGALGIKVWPAHRDDFNKVIGRDKQGVYATREFNLVINDVPVKCAPGQEFVLGPRERITLYGKPPKGSDIDGYIYHRFWGEKKNGITVLEENSRPNDDTTDNRFFDPKPRFDKIQPDEAPYRLLCNEVNKLFFGDQQQSQSVRDLLEAKPVSARNLDTRLIQAGVLLTNGRIAEDCYKALQKYFVEKMEK